MPTAPGREQIRYHAALDSHWWEAFWFRERCALERRLHAANERPEIMRISIDDDFDFSFTMPTSTGLPASILAYAMACNLIITRLSIFDVIDCRIYTLRFRYRTDIEILKRANGTPRHACIYAARNIFVRWFIYHTRQKRLPQIWLGDEDAFIEQNGSSLSDVRYYALAMPTSVAASLDYNVTFMLI